MKNKRLTKLTLILVLIILLPTLFYSIYEMRALSEKEELISKIYHKQLDTILFSQLVQEHAHQLTQRDN